MSQSQQSQGPFIEGRDPTPSPRQTGQSEYSIEKVEAPDQVTVGEDFLIEVRVCCNGDEQCPEDTYVLEGFEIIQGPAGIWPFPAANRVVRELTAETIFENGVAMVPECFEHFFSREWSVDSPGTYKVVATVADEEMSDTFEAVPA